MTSRAGIGAGSGRGIMATVTTETVRLIENRIETRETWDRLNRAIQREIEMAANPKLALELALFKSDLNVALYRKFQRK